MKSKLWFILIGAGVLVMAAFLLLDFRLAFSNTGTEKLVMSMDMGENNMPVSMQRRERISLVVTGEGPLAGALQKALTEELQAAGLVSRPGYHRYLAEYLAGEIVTVLKGMYKV